ncbi:MAG: DUF4417 domain-containing protein [Oscillospiraceae bacterium]|nr:DUF4417 domain-containing protein [Oscillospiraceae bacterium]
MSDVNCTRKGCKDVFNSFLVKNATFASNLEIPCIKAEYRLPAKLISFSKAVSKADASAWVHFYEDDAAFERLWTSPKRYLPILKRFAGVIAPDFSLYRDMPLVMQQWNVYRSHAIAHWLQENGISVIANVRWGDWRTFDLCCAGVPQNATFAVGSHGCVKLLREREYFKRGLEHVVKLLSPKTIIVYGTTPDEIFGRYKDAGISILQFNSDYMDAHRKEVSA